MTHKRHFLVLVVLLVFAFTGCHRATVTTSTYVSKDDATHLLKLTDVPSLKVALVGAFHRVDSTGSFTMDTDKGTLKGTFTYVHNSKGEKGYIFHPDIGDRWDVTLSADNSFTDKNGGVWRLQEVKQDQTPSALEQHLQKIGG